MQIRGTLARVDRIAELPIAFAKVNYPCGVQTPHPGLLDQRELGWLAISLRAGPNQDHPTAEAIVHFDRFTTFIMIYIPLLLLLLLLTCTVCYPADEVSPHCAEHLVPHAPHRIWDTKWS